MPFFRISTLAVALLCLSTGCAPEEKKVEPVTPENKAALDAQHAAVQQSIQSGGNPADAYNTGAGGAAPAAGHTPAAGH